MADEDDSQKTEDPTEKKLSRAREKGEIASSQEVKSWGVLMAGTAALVFMSPFIAERITNIGRTYVEKSFMLPLDFEGLLSNLTQSIIDTGIALSPFLILVVIFASASTVMQSGLIFAPDKIKPDLKKISPLAGIKRMFSSRSVVEFIKGIFKLLLVGSLAVAMTIPFLGDMELLPGASLGAILDRVQDVIIIIALAGILVMTVIATLDFVYQKYQFTKKMMMSKQEIKDEHKQAEGDPQVKAKIRALRQQRAQERMMANVPNADVVVTNPTHYAVALEYKMDEMTAPRLIAKGMDSLALRIREVAEEHDIPIIENAPLARALHASVELEEEIPPEHFIAVAEVIGYVMRMKGKTVH